MGIIKKAKEVFHGMGFTPTLTHVNVVVTGRDARGSFRLQGTFR